MSRRSILQILSVAAAAWLAASSASAEPPPAPAMPLGRPLEAPLGFLEFCTRQAEDCGGEPVRLAAETRVAESRTGPERASPAAVQAPSTRAAAAAAARHEAPSFAVFSVADAADRPAIVTMTVDLWATLKSVNSRVNAAILPRADHAEYGVDDYWTLPLEAGAGFGDCEDYVLEKRRALLMAGVDPRALNIALVVTSWGETHAVLLVATSQGEYVLDNLSAWVVRWDRAGYSWLERQVNGEPFAWRQVKPAAAAARMAQASAETVRDRPAAVVAR